MSQYPSPYQTPQPWPVPQTSASAAPPPARRAGVLLFVLGGLSVVSSLCCGVTGGMIPQLLARHPEMSEQIPPEITPELMREGLLLFSGVAFLYGVALVGLGFFVRRHARWAHVVALVIAGLSLMYLLLSSLKSVVALRTQGPEAAIGLCFVVVPVALFVLLIVWLIQALGSASAQAPMTPEQWLAMQQQQHAAYQQWQQWQQHQQHQQNQQQSQQGGPPMPPPPPPTT